ncbi:ATP-grasp domain-containing protein [Algoriphagus algorifonticola]|uniref:ATP-grasp domain-containing protein n=1 Tax=Algoriphagus algorifonticola TaxID=2593007 RepID=UPI001642D1D1|nr:ATP-grasp domain-containing protein [Algoriphagus algorifonticola]
MHIKSKVVLIFSGNNQRAVIAFCRYVLQEGILFCIVANGKEDTIFESSYANQVIATRRKNELDFDSIINLCEICKRKYDVDEVLILPSTEFLNRFLLQHKEKLKEKKIEFALCDEVTYSLVSDKYEFSEYCKSQNIPVPEDFDSPPKKYPYVMKPKYYGKGLSKINEKPVLVFSKNDLNKAGWIGNSSDYYFQEYVDGKSYYLLFYFFKNGKVECFSQENLIQQDEGASMILARSSTIHQHEIAQQFIFALKKINFSGLVMVEVKFDGEKFVMIEANPRLWGPSQLILDSNMTLFDAFAVDNGLKDKIINHGYRSDEFYFWSGGLVANQRQQKQPKFYNYSKSQFFEDFEKLTTHDIYLKEDTIKIYLNEHN